MKVFVIMPFAEEYNDVYKIGIKESASEENVIAYRLDEELFDQGMLDKIYTEIENSDFIIADLSNKNANVFYELGYAHAKEKLCILITKDVENIPFDLKHKRHIVYGSSISYLREQLKKNIKWAKEEILKKKNNPFTIEFKVSGVLDTTEEYADANLTFILDIENNTNKTSPEIHSINIYSHKSWKIKHDGKLLPYKKSNAKSYNYVYSLKCPQTKIPKQGWMQIELDANRTLANAWSGDEIKDSYKVSGTMLLELMTDREPYTFSLPLSLTIDTLPF